MIKIEKIGSIYFVIPCTIELVKVIYFLKRLIWGQNAIKEEENKVFLYNKFFEFLKEGK